MENQIIKRFIAIICLLMLVSCTKKPDEALITGADNGLTQTEASLANEESAGTQDLSEEINLAEIRRDRGLDAQYIRTNEHNSGQITYPTVSLITSRQECSDYYNQYKEYLHLERREPKNSEDTIGFLDACERYDEAFWKQNDLVIILCWEASGSYRHVVTGIESIGDAHWGIDVLRISPYGKTMDEAIWCLIVEVPKGKIGKNDIIEVDVEEMEVKNILFETSTENESETDSMSETEAEERPEMVTDLTAHYIRGGDSSTGHTVPRIIYSADEFKVYCEQEEKFSSKAEFQTIVERYDETFWENYDLVMVKRSENSGSFRHEVLNITRGKGYWDINVRHLSPAVYSQDMALWTFLIEVPEGILRKDDVVRMKYYKDSNEVSTSTSCLRTDAWKPADGDKTEDLDETSWYFMETKDDLKKYCEAHPELEEEFSEFCNKFNDDFWKEKDLLLIVQREESSSVSHKVGTIFRNGAFGSYIWLVSLERTIPQTQTDEEAIWHFFVEVEEGKFDSKYVFRIHKKDVIAE